jgi:hypothetical protein
MYWYVILVDLSLYSGASDGVAAPTPVEPPSLPFDPGAAPSGAGTTLICVVTSRSTRWPTSICPATARSSGT